MKLREFAELAVRLDGVKFSLADRPHLWAVYDCAAKNMVLRASRQCEKSTYFVNRILHHAITYPGIRILFVSPRDEQNELFSRDRLQRTIVDSPLIRERLWPQGSGKMPINNIAFKNQSRVYFRSVFHDANRTRGITADELLVDEFQDVAPGELAVIQETMSHSDKAWTALVGTPKLVDNPLETMFTRSTANEWRVTCDDCQHLVLLDETAIGEMSFICSKCSKSIDPRKGRWVPRNPAATLIQGFWINHLMLCWLNIHDVLSRRASYDSIRFRNEVLGLPVVLGDHMVTRSELDACCGEQPMASSLEEVPAFAWNRLVAAIDWGGGTASATALVIGFLTPHDMHFHICLFRRWLPGVDPLVVRSEVAQVCNQFRVHLIAADGGGNGSVYNRLLVDALSRPVPTYAIHYSIADQEPTKNGFLVQWTIGRTRSISTLLTKIKLRQIHFPRSADCGSQLDEFAGLLAEHDDYNHSIKFTHTPGQFDDSVHACNYAHVLALRTAHAHH